MLAIARLSATCARCGHARVYHALGGACHHPLHPRCDCQRFVSRLANGEAEP